MIAVTVDLSIVRLSRIRLTSRIATGLRLNTENEWEAVVMAEDYQLKHVGTVAGIIAAVVLVLGLGGLLLTLMT